MRFIVLAALAAVSSATGIVWNSPCGPNGIRDCNGEPGNNYIVACRDGRWAIERQCNGGLNSCQSRNGVPVCVG